MVREKLLAAEAAAREAVLQLEDAMHEARATRSPHGAAVEVLLQAAESLMLSANNLAAQMLAEVEADQP